VAVEERKGVQVWIILLQDIDFQRGFDLGVQAAARVGGIFNGLVTFSLASTPPHPMRDREALSIFVDSSKVGEAVAQIVNGLGLSKDGYLVQATPSSQFVPKQRPNQTAA